MDSIEKEPLAEVKDVPYIAHESAMARSERHIKRLWLVIIICIALLFSCNALWLYEWCQYDYVGEETSTTYSQDGEGLNIIGNRNEARYVPEYDGY